MTHQPYMASQKQSGSEKRDICAPHICPIL